MKPEFSLGNIHSNVLDQGPFGDGDEHRLRSQKVMLWEMDLAYGTQTSPWLSGDTLWTLEKKNMINCQPLIIREALTDEVRAHTTEGQG